MPQLQSTGKPISPRRWQQATLGVVCCFALSGLMMTFIVQSSFRIRAVKVQLVRIDPTQHNPFGPMTIEVGEPKMLILESPDVLLKNKTALGLPTMDVDYLRQHQGAALDIEPVESAIQIARIGCIVACFVSGLGAYYLPRLAQEMVPPAP